jgi:hypothetical protein
MALRVFACKGCLESDEDRDIPMVRNLPMNIPSNSGIPPQGASNSNKPIEGRGLKSSNL